MIIGSVVCLVYRFNTYLYRIRMYRRVIYLFTYRMIRIGRGFFVLLFFIIWFLKVLYISLFGYVIVGFRFIIG